MCVYIIKAKKEGGSTCTYVLPEPVLTSAVFVQRTSTVWSTSISPPTDDSFLPGPFFAPPLLVEGRFFFDVPPDFSPDAAFLVFPLADDDFARFGFGLDPSFGFGWDGGEGGGLIW
jgi:hypothetical protein